MIQNTPIESYDINSTIIFVKREDLACLPPGPPFAKVRGLLPVLLKYKEQGFKTFGYLDTSTSMAGWGVSYFCKQLGLNSVVFYPKYKNNEERHNQKYQLEKWKNLNAEIIPILTPGRAIVNWYQAKKILKSKYPDSIMLRQGLPFEETITEVGKQVLLNFQQIKKIKSIVVCIGSGVMTAGIIRELVQMNISISVYGVMVLKKNQNKLKEKIYKFAKINPKFPGFFLKKSEKIKLQIIDAGYEYAQSENCFCPFPCNPYYDRKAWKWMVENLMYIPKPILFWNIGSDYKNEENSNNV